MQLTGTAHFVAALATGEASNTLRPSEGCLALVVGNCQPQAGVPLDPLATAMTLIMDASLTEEIGIWVKLDRCVQDQATVDVSDQQAHAVSSTIFSKITTSVDIPSVMTHLDAIGPFIVTHFDPMLLRLVIECPERDSADKLWNSYQCGKLNELFQKDIVTNDVLKECGISEIILKTTIESWNYEKCVLYFKYDETNVATKSSYNDEYDDKIVAVKPKDLQAETEVKTIDTPLLHQVVMYDDIELVEDLLSSGININDVSV
ncbi:uncharacterized protein LOC102801950, partial [Saccoglossus kowalevskii]|uniref:Uncharacterized protein LOC102801950 n=1 Tax=Saccoglossus kowalevskii TaxID=10224 RepID=A0ABM0MNG2_SACKO